MHKEGFHDISYAKGLYYDGHDCPDVVEHQQNHFLLMLKIHEHQLVGYVVGDENNEVVANALIMWSGDWYCYIKMRQQVRQMMVMIKAGFVTMSFHSGRRGRAGPS